MLKLTTCKLDEQAKQKKTKKRNSAKKENADRKILHERNILEIKLEEYTKEVSSEKE